MEKVIYLDKYKFQKSGERISRFWEEQFVEKYDPQDGFSGISDETLLFLANSDEESAFTFYRLIMQTLDLGTSQDFSSLQSSEKSQVIDIQFYLADRIRFEMMKRLDWLETYNGQSATLMEIITAFDRFQHEDFQKPPQLARTHKNYDSFEHLINREKVVFVRKLFPNLLQAFEEITSRSG